MSLKFFGTDGIRGPYGGPALNDGIAYRAGRAAAVVAKEKLGAGRPKIVVGRDTRSSGAALLKAFALGVSKEGGTVVDLGVAPTPCVAYGVRVSDAHLGCSLTASHNPAQDNGIKFFGTNGVKPSEDWEQALDDGVGAVDAAELDLSASVETECGESLKRGYAESLIAFFPPGLLSGKRVALDCANGAMSDIAPHVFEALGAAVDVVANKPNGTNINAGVGSEHPESLGSLYSNADYDLGFAFDGDGDRVILSDENGVRVSGEAILAALALDAFERDALPGDTLVTTVQSNLGLDAALRACGVRVARTDVGDKHIARLMLAEGYAVGGEESGHVVLGAIAITGDGLAAAVALAELVARKGKSISELASVYRAFPQSSVGLKVASKPPISECPNLAKCIQELEQKLGEDGRLLVRYSGTESKIRLLVEARTQDDVDSSMTTLRAAVERDLTLL